jgi:hypothetical protein
MSQQGVNWQSMHPSGREERGTFSRSSEPGVDGASSLCHKKPPFFGKIETYKLKSKPDQHVVDANYSK